MPKVKKMTRYTIEMPINLSFQWYIIHFYINFFKVDQFFEEILQDYLLSCNCSWFFILKIGHTTARKRHLGRIYLVQILIFG